MHFRAALAGLLLAVSAAVAPLRADDLAPLADRPSGIVADVIDGATLALQDGRRVRLAGMLVPAAGDGVDATLAAPHAAAARRLIGAAALGQTVALFAAGPAERDRHRRVFAVVRAPDRALLQEALLDAGLARVLPDGLHHRFALAWLKREDAARRDRRGLWAAAAYRPVSDRAAAGRLDGYRLVEGRVLRAAETRDFLYLNFDRDIRTDFTVGLDREAARRFRAAAIEPLALEGRRVRVRGWVSWRGGPFIQAHAPAAIELLD
jgi:micrococcal nuclease